MAGWSELLPNGVACQYQTVNFFHVGVKKPAWAGWWDRSEIKLSTAPPPLPLVLGLGFLLGLPLHVARIVCATVRQRIDVVDHVARAGESVFPGGRAGLFFDEGAKGGFAAMLMGMSSGAWQEQ